MGSLLAGVVAAEGEFDWRLEKDGDGVQIYTRAVEGQKIREIRGVTRIDARLSAVAAVIDDVPAAPRLSAVVSESRVVQRQSATAYQLYQVLKMTWPLDDRDMVSQRAIRQDEKTGVVTILNRAVPDAMPPQKGRVRILASRLDWILTPQPDGQVLAEMTTLTDPNGAIPVSVINALSVNSPFESMQSLRALATSAAYQQAPPSFVREPAH